MLSLFPRAISFMISDQAENLPLKQETGDNQIGIRIAPVEHLEMNGSAVPAIADHSGLCNRQWQDKLLLYKLRGIKSRPDVRDPPPFHRPFRRNIVFVLLHQFCLLETQLSGEYHKHSPQKDSLTFNKQRSQRHPTNSPKPSETRCRFPILVLFPSKYLTGTFQ